MKPFTKEVLDNLTEALIPRGLKKIRRGRSLTECETGIYSGVEIQPREWPNGDLTLSIFAISVWPDAERICAIGNGGKFSITSAVTVSKFILAPEKIKFEPNIDQSHMFEKFLELIDNRIVAKMPSTGTREFIKTRLINNMDAAVGPSRPDLLISISILESGIYGSVAYYNKLLETIKNDAMRSQFEMFWKRVRENMASSP